MSHKLAISIIITVLLFSGAGVIYPSEPATVQTDTSILSFEAGLVFSSGDVKYVARTIFYLLDDDFGKILKDVAPKRHSFKAEYIAAVCGEDPEKEQILEFGNVEWLLHSNIASGKDKSFYLAGIKALRPHIIRKVTTNFTGKASFEPVPVGTYYLMGVAPSSRGFVVWNLKIKLKTGQTSVILDQKNAVIVHSW